MGLALGLSTGAVSAVTDATDVGLRYLALDGKQTQGGVWYNLAPSHGRDWFTRFSEPGREILQSGFSMSRDQGPLSLQWGSAQGGQQQLQQLGLSFEGLGVSAFFGDGDTVGDVRHPWRNAGHFHFHGGLLGDYDFDGFRVDYALNPGSELAFTRAEVRAGNLETRSTSELRLGLGDHSLTLIEVDSAGERAGQAFAFGTRLGSLALSMQHMVAENSASWSALSMSTRSRGKTLGIRFEQRRNPLYEAANENRIMLSMGYTLRGSSLLRAAESAENANPDDEEAEKSYTVPILVGAGAVGAALALSSGGGNEDDTRPRFQSQNGAAKQVLNELNPRSIQQNREWGGYVSRRADGTYSSTPGIPGEAASVSLPAPENAVPGGSIATASYHTHGAFDPRYDNENFSPQDIFSDIIFGLDGYLGTPQGQFKFHDLSANEVVTLGGPGTLATQ